MHKFFVSCCLFTLFAFPLSAYSGSNEETKVVENPLSAYSESNEEMRVVENPQLCGPLYAKIKDAAAAIDRKNENLSSITGAFPNNAGKYTKEEEAAIKKYQDDILPLMLAHRSLYEKYILAGCVKKRNR